MSVGRDAENWSQGNSSPAKCLLGNEMSDEQLFGDELSTINFPETRSDTHFEAKKNIVTE